MQIRKDVSQSSDNVWLLLTKSGGEDVCKAEYGEIVALPELIKDTHDEVTNEPVTEHLHVEILESCLDR